MAGGGGPHGHLEASPLREELLRVRADANALRQRVEEVEQLRLRAAGELVELRTELQKRNDAYRDLLRRHEELQGFFALASEQLDGIAENGTLRWLRPSDSEARGRIIAAEQLTHELLIGLSDELSSIADTPGTALFLGELRDRMATILEQLEATRDELAIVSERLSRHDQNPMLRLVRRILASRTYRRLRLAFRTR